MTHVEIYLVISFIVFSIGHPRLMEDKNIPADQLVRETEINPWSKFLGLKLTATMDNQTILSPELTCPYSSVHHRALRSHDHGELEAR